MKKDFMVFDSDSHVVEPAALWETYLDPEYRALGKHALWRHEGANGAYLKVNGEIFRDRSSHHIPRHAIWRPGMTWDDVGALDPDVQHPANAGASDPKARLADMDAMGVDQALHHPTWFAEGFFLVRDPDVAYALARAYNDWVADFCKAAPDRLFASAVLPLQNIDYALEELARIAKNPSFRAVFIRPMFLEDRYLNHPYFDPLWAGLERLGVPVAVHATAGLWNPEWTSHGPFFEKIKDRLAQPMVPAGGGPFAGGSGGAKQTMDGLPKMPLGHPMAQILAPWLDNHLFVGSTLIGYTVMERFPAMKVAVVHGKAAWMEEVLEKMEASTRVIPLLHHYPMHTEPEELWEHGQVMLGFDAEERLILKLPQEFAEKVVWGSRYPQQDTTSAFDALARLREAKVPEAMIAEMMGGNAARQFAVEPRREAVA